MSLQVKTCLSIGGLGFDICKPGQANCVKMIPTNCNPGNGVPGPGPGDGGGDDGGGSPQMFAPQDFSIQDLEKLVQDIIND
jgi:hypothetical protein